MVILQFNKLIRNKWVWGVFAIAISVFFAFDFLIADLDRDTRGSGVGAGTIAGEEVASDLFTAVVEDVRGFGQNRDWKRKNSEVNRTAWETLAALTVAKANGVEATDADVREAIRHDRTFAPNGAFSFAVYEQMLRANGMNPERFEAFLKRRLTMMRLGEAMIGSAAWVSPMELDRAVADVTDRFTVRVARFTQTKEEVDKVKVDDAAVEKWYNANTNSLALPERVQVRFVKFDATDAKVQAKMAVTEDELKDHYDATVDKYTSTDTNGVEKVKAFADVKKEVEKEVRQIAAVQFFETNLNRRAYSVAAKKGASRLDEIAKEDGLKVQTSDWFATDGSYLQGFGSSASAVAPGCEGFLAAVAELDPSSEDLRYAVVASDKAVWLLERAELSPAHLPTFAEAKEAIRPRALRAAQQDAFKEAVTAIAAKGTNAVCTTKNVSTNFTFAICDLGRGDFPDQNYVASAARKLKPGEISEFTPTGLRSGLLVVCTDRQPGDAAQAQMFAAQIRDSVAQAARGQLPANWQKWNLERLGFEPADFASVEETAEEAE